MNVSLPVFAYGAVALFAVYLAWWHGLYVRTAPRPGEPALPYLTRLDSELAAILSGRRVSDLIAANQNFAVTLPHPWKRCAIVFVVRDVVDGDQLDHDVGGHGRQLAEMGPVAYLAKHLWYKLVLRRPAADDPTEQDANRRAARIAGTYKKRRVRQRARDRA